MNGTPFKLATFAKPNAGPKAKPFATIVLGEQAVDLAAAHTAYRAARGGQALTRLQLKKQRGDSASRGFVRVYTVGGHFPENCNCE